MATRKERKTFAKLRRAEKRSKTSLARAEKTHAQIGMRAKRREKAKVLRAKERRIAQRPQKQLKAAKAELRQSARVERAKTRIAQAKTRAAKWYAERPTTIRRQRVTRSAPGESPAIQTGRLLGSIEIQKPLEPMVRQIVATAPYAKYLEFGTKNIAPRPFLRVGLNRNIGQFEAMMKGII